MAQSETDQTQPTDQAPQKKTYPYNDMEEARKAIEIAEKKISEKDYHGAKRFVNKAQSLYPKLDGLKQVLMIIHVYQSATNGSGLADWYKILGVDTSTEDEEVKKQYKKLALALHPDKNKFEGAEGAFKLVLEAWCILSDKVKRDSYDQKRKSREANIDKSASNNGHQEDRNVVDPSNKKIGKTSERKKQQNRHMPSEGDKRAFMNSSKLRKGDYIYNYM